MKSILPRSSARSTISAAIARNLSAKTLTARG
jgi:hypothetical protein